MPGAVVWLTGLPSAGKTTLAHAVAARLAGRAPRVEVLDGDVVREKLAIGGGFSRAERDANVNRIGYLARLLARHDVLVLAAVIAPYAETRAQVRADTEAEGIPFVEVFVRAELESVIARDVKGLYKRALAGEITELTGVSDPYEAPTAPDVEVQTDRDSIDTCAARIVDALAARGLV